MSKKSKRIISAFTVLLIIIVLAVSPIFEPRPVKDTDPPQILEESWGLKNTGQTIEGQVGKRGIDLNVEKARKYVEGGPAVAILDTGVAWKNPYIRQSLIPNPREGLQGEGTDGDMNGFPGDAFGWNFYDNNSTLDGDLLNDAHGTFVAGTVAGRNIENFEKHIYLGSAPHSSLLFVKVMSSSTGSIDNVVAAIEYIDSRGVNIVNCSWSVQEYSEEIKQAIATRPHMLFVCAAGKTGENLDENPVYPACYDLPNVVAVAAVDNRGELYEMSGYGKNVDVAAPGVNIYGITSPNPAEFDYLSGTSVATAYVSGVASLIMGYRSQLTAEEVAKILKNPQNSKRISSLKGKVASKGILDAHSCIISAHWQTVFS